MEAMDGEKIRRQVYNLTASDMSRFPAWQFALDEEGEPDQDEATVRPYEHVPANSQDGLMIVRARFRLSDGSRMTGYVYPSPPDETWDIQLLQPVIVQDENQIGFWFGMSNLPVEELQKLLALLGKTKSQVFPMTYESDAEMSGGQIISGTIEGFSFLKDGKVELFAI